MKKLRVVQIGAEHDHASFTTDSIKRLNNDYELVGYAVPDGEKVLSPDTYKEIKRLSVNEALNMDNIDAAIIETYDKNLTKYAVMAAEKGLAVHMDKPGGTELSDFERLISTVKKNNTVFHTGYMYRYNPEVVKLFEEIDSGIYGEIYAVEAHMDCMHGVSKREWLGDFKGGQLFYLGCHLIDLIYRIMGEPDEVIPLNCSTGFDNISSEDYGMAILKYKNGVSFAKTCAIEPGGYMRRQLVICGNKGTAELCPFEAYAENDLLYTGVRKVTDNIYDWSNDGVRYNSENYNRYDTMMKSFAEYVRGEKTNPYTYDYELKLYKLLLKCCGYENL